MSSETGGQEDQYYRELLARVDNAIVETREPDSDEWSAEALCKGCLQKSVAAVLVVAAIVTECCVSAKLALLGVGAPEPAYRSGRTGEQSSSSHAPNIQADGGYEL